MQTLEILVEDNYTTENNSLREYEIFNDNIPSPMPSYGKKDRGYRHVVNSTTISSIMTPLYAAMHNIIGMTKFNSGINRLLTIGPVFLGLGDLYEYGRAKSRSFFKVDKEKFPFSYAIHDALYTAAFNAIISPIFLLASGERDPTRLLEATLFHLIVAIPSGIATGFAVDNVKDLLEIKKSKRYMPKWLRNGSKKTKRMTIAAGLLASALITAGIYTIPSWNKVEEQKTTTMINNNINDK